MRGQRVTRQCHGCPPRPWPQVWRSSGRCVPPAPGSGPESPAGPPGTLYLAVGRRVGIATLMWVCAFFLTLDYLVAPSAHDVLDMTPTQIGWALTAGGIGWSVVALVCGAHPAWEPKAYRRRTTLAAAFFVLGAALMTTTGLGRPGWWGAARGLRRGWHRHGPDPPGHHEPHRHRSRRARWHHPRPGRHRRDDRRCGSGDGHHGLRRPPRHPVSRRTGCGRHSSCSPWGSSSPRCWPDAPPELAGGPTRPRAVPSPPCGSFVCAETAAGAAPRQNHRAPSEGRRHTTKDFL